MLELLYVCFGKEDFRIQDLESKRAELKQNYRKIVRLWEIIDKATSGKQIKKEFIELLRQSYTAGRKQKSQRKERSAVAIETQEGEDISVIKITGLD